MTIPAQPQNPRLPGQDYSQSDQAIYDNNSRNPTYFSGGTRFSTTYDFVPTISQADIDKQSFTRYFAKNVGADTTVGEIVETDRALYDRLARALLYQVITIEWRIVGKISDVYSGPIRTYVGVATSNTLAIQIAEQTMPGISKKLVDPLQFFQHE